MKFNPEQRRGSDLALPHATGFHIIAIKLCGSRNRLEVIGTGIGVRFELEFACISRINRTWHHRFYPP